MPPILYELVKNSDWYDFPGLYQEHDLSHLKDTSGVNSV